MMDGFFWPVIAAGRKPMKLDLLSAVIVTLLTINLDLGK